MSTKRNVKPKSKGKSTNKRSYSRKDQKKDIKDNDTKSVESTDYNDPSWRLANASTILDRATKFVFNDYMHVYDNDSHADVLTYMEDNSKTLSAMHQATNAAQIPSIMSIRLNPSPGSYIIGNVSAIKQQAQSLYTALSSMNAKPQIMHPRILLCPF